MEWRCEWCGKPHETEDPPCDNCGHGTFERAVVQQPAQGSAGESTTLWVCTDCGREHTKHSPPCSRCGNPTLERREYTVEDDELAVPSYFDLVTPKYVLGVLAVLLFAGILVLGLAGVIDLPGMAAGSPDVPDPEAVPGDAESYDDMSLDTVEAAYVDRFNEFRTGVGIANVTRSDRLDGVASDVNLLFVDARAGDGEYPTSEELGQVVGSACRDSPILPQFSVSVDGGTASADATGRSIAEFRIDEFDTEESADSERIGVDVHAADDMLYVTEVTC